MDKRVLRVEFDEQAEGISLISIVAKPAIESNFIKLSEEESKLMLSSDESKQYVTGAVLIPDIEIKRTDDKGEYFITFSAEDIEKFRNKFFRSGELKMSNLDHSKNDLFEAYLIESWIVADETKDKAKALGLSDVKVGSLYATYHIPDTVAWQEVSKRNGFSVEIIGKTKPVDLAEVDEFDVLLNNLMEAVNEGE